MRSDFESGVRSWNGKFLGVRYNTYQGLDFSAEYNNFRLLPYINKAFACTWVFADSLLFVGMLNSQNSLLNENVVAVWYYTFLCRAFQFAGTFFMDRVLFEAEMMGDGTSVHKKHEPNIITACCQLCSLWCYILVVLHFSITMGYPLTLNQDMGIMQTLALQVSFLVIMTTLELARHVLVFYSLVYPIHLGTFQTAARWIYLVDCVLRTALIVSTAIAASQALGDQNETLYTYLKLRTA